MTQEFRLFQVDAFTDRAFTGNGAGVVLDADGLSPETMQAIARELNNSETAFVLEPDGPDHDVRVRYFTPTMEVPTCGHATVAAHFVRATVLGLPEGRVRSKIGLGVLPVDIERVGDRVRVTMTQGRPRWRPPLARDEAAAVHAALGVDDADLDSRCPIQWVDTGAPKILVGLRRRSTLDRLTPDPVALLALNREIPNRGVFPFVLEEGEPRTRARMFAPQIGIPEDPVTGNGNGPLGVYLVLHGLIDAPAGTARFEARQGEAMGRPGTVTVTVDAEGGKPTRARVTGDAVIVFEATIRM